MVVVCVILSCWAIVNFCMDDCVVEEASDLVNFVSTRNESFEKTFVRLSLSFLEEKRVKIRNNVLYMIPGSSASRWAEWGGGGGGGDV